MPYRRPEAPIPPGLFPAGFIKTHDLYRRLVLRPLQGLTPAAPWAPLTDAEWDRLSPLLAELGCGLAEAPRAGRPMASPRDRLDAIFRAVTLKHPKYGRAAWSQLPAEFGKPDTVSRTHRRWGKANLWARLLVEVALHPTAMAALAHRICCAFRRAFRQMGLRGIVLARRLGLFSALPAPSAFLPDPDLSEIYKPVQIRFAESMKEKLWHPPKRLFRALASMYRMAGGRARIQRGWEPA